MVPIRGCCFGSTTRVREVPSASGWPGQSAADAVCAVMQVNSPRHKPAHCRVRAPATTLPIINTVCIPFGAKSYRRGSEHRINCLSSPDDVHDMLSSRHTVKVDPCCCRHHMD